MNSLKIFFIIRNERERRNRNSGSLAARFGMDHQRKCKWKHEDNEEIEKARSA